MNSKAQPRVVIVGAGFGGLNAALTLAKAPVRVTLMDRKNHHTFQPLLYQVATAGLSPGEIAAPIRAIVGKRKNIEVLMAEVTGFDLEHRVVQSVELSVSYDYLIVAAGARHSYFGHPEWEPYAPGLKTIEDATEIRRRILLAFELAEKQAAAGRGQEPLNFIVVGGGPTGVELAGTLAEISRHALKHEFRSIDPSRAHILLLEGGPRILPAYPEDLSRSAQKQLEHLGVEVRTSSLVTKLEPGAVDINSQRINASVVLWAAGVAASPLGKQLGVQVDRAGRVPVQPDLSLPGHPDVFVIGDLAALNDEHGDMLPGVAPVAIQQGEFAAKLIREEVSAQARAQSYSRPAFHYWDKGSLATIGRNAGVAQFGKWHVSGYLAWLMWLFVHIFFLIGFENRVLVFIQWAWSYITYERGARLITGSTELPGWSGLRHEPPIEAEERAASEIHAVTRKIG